MLNLFDTPAQSEDNNLPSDEAALDDAVIAMVNLYAAETGSLFAYDMGNAVAAELLGVELPAQ